MIYGTGGVVWVGSVKDVQAFGFREKVGDVDNEGISGKYRDRVLVRGTNQIRRG